MKKQRKSNIEKYFRKRALSYEDDKKNQGIDLERAHDIISIEKTVRRIIKSNEVLFHTYEDKHGKKYFQYKDLQIFDQIKRYGGLNS